MTDRPILSQNNALCCKCDVLIGIKYIGSAKKQISELLSLPQLECISIHSFLLFILVSNRSVLVVLVSIWTVNSKI